ncbi:MULTISPECIES: hypothetical protein [unclassified Ensifer]|uniref:hypothetical protein n=1 Tax=unclassified Ensifer TaxID=2633371 RepID=UPI000812FD52|nr:MULTISPECIES: hypothetical protein [unclassified Ensifer]OCP17440.1 hypothetical protein BC361_08255 [Ensifer sp. LC54]OCP28654.1 hypothetical protein BC363_02100 [Ensifer sp. LC384]
MTSKPAKQQTENSETPSSRRVEILVVTAPGGPRRRAGLSFGPAPVELLASDLGENPEETLNILRADSLLKIDAKVRELPPETPDQE